MKHDRQPKNKPVAARLYGIREVSELTGVSPYALRRWDRGLPGFFPIVRTPGGPRRYAPDSIELIRRMDELVHREGLSLIGARRRIEEGVRAAEGVSLADKLLRDKHVVQAIEELSVLVRRKIFEEMGSPARHRKTLSDQ